MTKWFDPRLEAAWTALDDVMAETHPEHGEYDTAQRACDAIEDADMALERLSAMRRNL